MVQNSLDLYPKEFERHVLTMGKMVAEKKSSRVDFDYSVIRIDETDECFENERNVSVRR